MSDDFTNLTPRQIVSELDRYIVGQNKAKRAVAIALRNRIRRQKLPESIKDEVAPKNILMIGPTGVGKTEIARRLAKLCGAPFIKVEATKYTEVGYVGRDVESMVRDLMQSGYGQVKQEMRATVKEAAAARVEDLLLDCLLPGSGEAARPKSQPLANIFQNLGAFGAQKAEGEQNSGAGVGAGTGLSPDLGTAQISGPEPAPGVNPETREKFRKFLREGKLEENRVEISVEAGGANPAIEIFSGNSMEEMEMNLSSLAGMFGGKRKKKSVTVREAREYLLSEEMDKLIDTDKVADEARRRVQEMGIIFIDEIDKIANREGKSGGQDVSREGVQRDILPIVEGSSVNTKYGMIDTTHILFIAAGAFTVSKPSDLIPELQGRFPIRVELEPLLAADFVRILTEPENALVRQYVELLKTEGVSLEITREAIERIADIAQDINTRNENIGARRLHTILERLLEELSFEASELNGQTISITPAYVEERFKDFFERQDLSKFIL
jgi:ATP-dependent HslUV protease ATP-binding subunit HslU